MITLSTGFRAGLSSNSILTLLNEGFIYLFNGTRPDSADIASGTAAGVITVNGQAPPSGGLTLSAHASGYLRNASTWKTRTLVAGTVTWFRYVDSSRTINTYSETVSRIDGDIGEELILPSPILVADQYQTVDTFFIVFA